MSEDSSNLFPHWFPHPWLVHATLVHGRTVFYLDQNAWIDLTDEKTDVAISCRKVCRAAVEARRVVFPASNASIFELMEHPITAHKEAQIQVMDELSMGVTFRPWWELGELEAVHLARLFLHQPFIGIMPSDVFTFPVGLLGRAVLEADDSEFLQKHQELLAATGFNTVAGFVRCLERDDTGWSLTAKEEWVTELQRIRLEGRNTTSTSRQRSTGERLTCMRMLLETIGTVLERSGIPADTVRSLEDVLNEFSPDSVAEATHHFMKACPSWKVYCEVWEQMAHDRGRNFRVQDYWDQDHLHYAPYSDFFVTGDKFLARMLEGCDLLRERNCQILAGLEELEAQVVEILSIDQFGQA